MDWRALSDEQVVDRLLELWEDEKRRLRDFIACLGDFDRRGLAKKLSYTSTFDYCVKKLGYSSDEAWRRVSAARAARLHPAILTSLHDGSANLTTIAIVGPHLTSENSEAVLKQVSHKTTKDVRKLASALDPEPDRPDIIRHISPEAAISTHEFPRQTLRPSAPGRLHVSFTASEEFHRIVERAKDLLWHKFPSGRLEDIVTEFGKYWLAGHDPGLKLKPAAERPPRAVETRRVPRWVRDKVWRRDGGRCAYLGMDDGKTRRCEATRGLEFDHIRPWAMGGASDDPANIRLLCRAHNQLRGREMFG